MAIRDMFVCAKGVSALKGYLLTVLLTQVLADDEQLLAVLIGKVPTPRIRMARMKLLWTGPSRIEEKPAVFYAFGAVAGDSGDHLASVSASLADRAQHALSQAASDVDRTPVSHARNRRSLESGCEPGDVDALSRPGSGRRPATTVAESATGTYASGG